MLKHVFHKKVCLSFCLISCVLVLLSPVVNAQTLTVSVSTASEVGRFENSNISGTLTLNGNPVNDGLVAVQAIVGSSTMLFLRTLNTGVDPQNLIAEIQTVYSSDSEGNPRSDFSTGGLAYFSVTVINNDVVSRNILVSVSVFDNLNCPLGYAASEAIVPPGSSNCVLGVPVPSWANDGRATVFAAAYSDLPSQGGTPYCPEASAVFTLNSEQGQAPPSTPSGSQGTYTLTYKVPPKADVNVGYSVYVSSLYSSSLTYSSTFFEVYQPGDFNGDGRVDFSDISAFVNIYIGYYEYGYVTNPAGDFNKDDRIDFSDISIFVNAYIAYYTYY